VQAAVIIATMKTRGKRSGIVRHSNVLPSRRSTVDGSSIAIALRQRQPVVLFHLIRDYPRFPGYYPTLHRSPYIELTHLYVILVFKTITVS
jgi:hypothetical protein